MRRLLILASMMVFFDVTFYSAIAPLLPTYVAEFGLNEAEAGILSAAYAAGTLVASLPAGFVATRFGPRRTAIGGLLLLGLSSLAFGFARDITLLDAARLVQGISGALIWSGALTWLITTAPDDQRGAVIGTALGTAVAGALVGPGLGAIAAEIGTEPVFGSVLLIALVLAFLASRLSEARMPEEQSLREVAARIFGRAVLTGTALVAVPSLMFGAIEVLVPLRIAALGGSHAVIAAGFVTGAALEAGLAPVAGRYSDRVGGRSPYSVGLAICAAAMTVIAVAQVLGVVLAGLIATSLGAGICFAPALAMLSEAAELSRLHQGFAAGLSNMAWAAGQVAGGVAGGAMASITGYAVPSLAIVALLLTTAAYARFALTPAAADPAGG
ncbi:MAG: MFS transporter [Solirubrobacterales bacterium]